MRKNRYFVSGLLLLSSLMFFNINAFSATQLPPQKLTVMLDWFLNPDHAPLFVAQNQGFFKQQNLDVELLGPANTDDPPKLLAAGKIDIAVMYQSQLVIDVAQGLPLVQIGTLVASPLSCLAVLADSPIKNLSDLKGKSIGYSSPSSDLPLLSVMLKSAGLSLKDVTLINVHYDLSQALLSKRIDAAEGMMRNFELTQLALAGHPARAFYPEEQGVPNYSELVLVTNKKELKDPRLPEFLKGLQAGTSYLMNHPTAAWQAFSQAHPELNNKLNQTAWFATLPRFASRPAIYDPYQYQAFAEFLQQEGLIKTVPLTKDYAQVLPH